MPPGLDVLTLEGGNDSALVDDGGTKDTVDCGTGTDSAKADAADVLTACESVTKPSTGTPTPTPTPSPTATASPTASPSATRSPTPGPSARSAARSRASPRPTWPSGT